MDEINLNPANEQPQRVTDESRVPMGMPQLTLEVPEIPGYKMHWFADRPGRIARALRGGYEFVSPDEIKLNNFSVADSIANSGNTDLGNRVSVYGGTDDKGSSVRLYLMKVKEEWWQKDMDLREETSERIVNTLRGGRVGAEKGSAQDAALRYTRGTENLFTRKRRR